MFRSKTPILFERIIPLVPDFLVIFERPKITLTQVFILWYIKKYGASFGRGQKVILLREIRTLLQQNQLREPSTITVAIQDLANEQLLISRDLTSLEKQRLFGHGKAPYAAVFLLPEGAKRLQQISRKANKLINNFLIAEMTSNSERSPQAAALEKMKSIRNEIRNPEKLKQKSKRSLVK